jgi:hypothetical protein
LRDDVTELARALIEQRACAEHRAVPLHGPLHRKANLARTGLALRPSDPVEPADGAVGRSIRHRRAALAGTQRLGHPVRGRAAEHDDVEQRV